MGCGWSESRFDVTVMATVTRLLLTMTDPEPSFVLAQRVLSQGRTVHIFSLEDYPTATIAGGLNTKNLSVPAYTFYRWLHLCNDALYSGLCPLDPSVVLRRITISTVDVMTYVARSFDGPVIPRNSPNPIEPGSYGLFLCDGTPYKGQVNCVNARRLSFEERDKNDRYPPGWPRQDAIPADLARLAASRDQVTISCALADDFKRNAISVDVDDAARIICFRNLSGAADSDKSQLQTHHSTVLGRPSEKFWREHFQYSLMVFFPTGSADFERDGYSPNALLEELLENNADLDSPKWRTQLGKEVLEVYMRQVILQKVDQRQLVNDGLDTSSSSSW
uniref:HNH nuclease domain-containing protein n=1 Tax=Mycena chlorophos TaxID=658473 RepID=A0ABQ0M3S4_MYCCL|nr:predicted protein [Mycena chlorophos]